MEVREPPLEDPDYRPLHPPVRGRIPDVVKKWGPRSQLRWFERFWGSKELPLLRPREVGEFYCQSVEHRGFCCSSCIEDEEFEGYPVYDDHCCCEGYRAAKEKE